eukprot:1195267-Prorocentrum_minimum.AAC.1
MCNTTRWLVALGRQQSTTPQESSRLSSRLLSWKALEGYVWVTPPGGPLTAGLRLCHTTGRASDFRVTFCVTPPGGPLTAGLRLCHTTGRASDCRGYVCVTPPDGPLTAGLRFVSHRCLRPAGGVDSSVALRLLLAAGHQCTAFYLQIWMQEDFQNFWGEDFQNVWGVRSKFPTDPLMTPSGPPLKIPPDPLMTPSGPPRYGFRRTSKTWGGGFRREGSERSPSRKPFRAHCVNNKTGLTGINWKIAPTYEPKRMLTNSLRWSCTFTEGSGACDVVESRGC